MWISRKSTISNWPNIYCVCEEGFFWTSSYIFHDKQQLPCWDKNGKQNTSARFPFWHNLWILMIIQPSLHLEGLIICTCTYWQLCSFGQICHDRFSGRVCPKPFFRYPMCEMRDQLWGRDQLRVERVESAIATYLSYPTKWVRSTWVFV